ncbi:hypothetical protein EV284_6471 [Streptomyces sp. BK022]|uniref:hypothetical protein n=1 Tax=Streptomyces sp. BK022 TaxID=2512123 RepID=UPI00102A14E0|nr:hypothetical protein [Streptomyces sp. BK022]RZU28305.1 hypothetical protein EV284_6471 [Streptomyces sp. BK022]
MRYRQADPRELEFRPWLTRAPEVRLVPTAESRLESVRRTCYADVLDRIGGSRPVRVAIYLRAAGGLDTDYWGHTLATLATARGWRVSGRRFTDAAGASFFPEFESACQYARQGYVDGILTIRRTSVPLDDETYEDRVNRLREHTTFLAFLQQVDPTSGGGAAW